MQGEVEVEALRQCLAASHAICVIVQLHVVFEMVEERRCHRHVAVRGKPVAHLAHVRVYPKDLLHHHQGAAWWDRGIRTPATDAASGGVE